MADFSLLFVLRRASLSRCGESRRGDVRHPLFFSRQRAKREERIEFSIYGVRTAVARIAQDRRLFGIRNDGCIYTKPGNEFSSNLGKQSGLERFRLVLSIQLIKIHARDSGSVAWARRSLVRVGLSMFGLGRSFPARDISRIEEREAG